MIWFLRLNIRLKVLLSSFSLGSLLCAPLHLLTASHPIEPQPSGPKASSSSIILKWERGDSRFLRAGAIAGIVSQWWLMGGVTAGHPGQCTQLFLGGCWTSWVSLFPLHYSLLFYHSAARQGFISCQSCCCTPVWQLCINPCTLVAHPPNISTWRQGDAKKQYLNPLLIEQSQWPLTPKRFWFNLMINWLLTVNMIDILKSTYTCGWDTL